MRREAWVGIALAAIAAAGVAVDATSAGVHAPSRSAPRGDFVQRAVFCPPPLRRGVESVTRLAVAPARHAGGPVRVQPQPRTLALGRDRLLTTTAPSSASSVTGYGTRVAATSTAVVTKPVPGAAAADCSRVASTDWFFAAGSSALGSDERLLIYNPFLAEAVVRVIFHTARGAQAKAGLADLAIPPGGSLQLAVNEFVLHRKLVGAHVAVTRGRVVAWQEAITARKREHGVWTTLGAPAPATTWFFPDGGVGAGYDEHIAVLNPSDAAARVTVTLSSRSRLIQPRRLVQLTIPPGAVRSVALRRAVGPPARPHGLSATVTTTGSAGVVAQRTVWYPGRRPRGVASETGATVAGRHWILGPAAWRPRLDQALVMNPGPSDVRVRISLIDGRGGLRTPARLAGLIVPGGLRLAVPLTKWTRGRAVGALVSATGAVVVERSSYSAAASDSAALMGARVSPSAPPR